jgi:Tfp pilus assembly protein PilX
MTHHHIDRQRGAALVIGLILLAVITLLAVVGMNIANSELASATSEQLRLRAFNAAETGLERRLETLEPDHPINSTPDVRAAVAVVNSPTSSATSAATDFYATTTTWRGEGSMISRYSGVSFKGFYYSVESTGTSARNARGVNTVGAFLVNTTGPVATYGPTTTPAPNTGAPPP